MELPTAQVTNPALIELPLVTTVVYRFRRRCIGVLVMSEVSRDRHFLECAIGRCRRKGKLERQQQEEEKGEEVTHGKIMAELLDGFDRDATSPSTPADPAAWAWVVWHSRGRRPYCLAVSRAR